MIPETSHQTRPKAVPKEVKFDVRILAFALPVFAVDDLGFRRMHLQATLRQAGLKLHFESLRFLLVTAVHQSIIRIPTPREIRMCPRHPEIERIVEKNVRQKLGASAPTQAPKSTFIPYRLRTYSTLCSSFRYCSWRWTYWLYSLPVP